MKRTVFEFGVGFAKDSPRCDRERFAVVVDEPLDVVSGMQCGQRCVK